MASAPAWYVMLTSAAAEARWLKLALVSEASQAMRKGEVELELDGWLCGGWDVLVNWYDEMREGYVITWGKKQERERGRMETEKEKEGRGRGRVARGSYSVLFDELLAECS